MADNGSLVSRVAELDEQRALELVKARIIQGEEPLAILSECRQGIEEVGKRFESGEYFIADLMFAASIFKSLMAILLPELKKFTAVETAGKILIATVNGDIHDIGKNLVASMLEASGYEVIDLGVNVPVGVICDAINDQRPDILALSCLLTSTIDSMEETIAGISTANLRSMVKVIVGGSPLSVQLAMAIGADSYGANAHDAVLKCRELLEERCNG